MKDLTRWVARVMAMTGDEVEAAASGSNANSIRFAIDSALLAVLPRSVQWASVVSELETLPILERHQALVSDGGSELFEQMAQNELKLHHEKLKETFPAATIELMAALAPHLAELGVGMGDSGPDGKSIVASVLEAASADGVEQLEAFVRTNPRELARQVAAMKAPVATFGIKMKASNSPNAKNEIAKQLGISPMQIDFEQQMSPEGLQGVDLQVLSAFYVYLSIPSHSLHGPPSCTVQGRRCGERRGVA